MVKRYRLITGNGNQKAGKILTATSNLYTCSATSRFMRKGRSVRWIDADWDGRMAAEGAVKQVICSSRVRCKPHARFQGGGSGATFSCYPTAGSQIHQKEVAGDAMFPLVPHRGENTGRNRSTPHDEKRASQKIGWQRRTGAGEGCREPLSGRGLADGLRRTFAPHNNFRNTAHRIAFFIFRVPLEKQRGIAVAMLTVPFRFQRLRL